MSKRGTRLAYLCVLLATSLCLPGVASGATWNVSTFPALYNAMINANPGDEVILYTDENMYFYQVREQVVVSDDNVRPVRAYRRPHSDRSGPL